MRPALALVALALPCGTTLAAQASVTNAQLARHIDSVFAAGATVGMSVAVVHGDSILLVRALGTADMATGRRVTAQTRFLTASTTKAFTALTAVLLDEAGTVELDASLATLLPEAELDSALSADSITLRDLLAMRHGIGRDGPVVVRTAYTGEFDTPALLRLIRLHGVSDARPRFEYGNVGYNIAALALERATGRRWQDLIERHVFLPLGMRETSSSLSAVADELAMPHELMGGGRHARIPLYKSDRTMHAAGGHATTARDLARFVIAQLNGGRVRGSNGVSARAISAMQRKEIDQDRDFAFTRRIGWGLGLDIAEYRGDTIYQRHGGFTGYYSHMSFMPSRRVGVVVLANGGGGGGVAAEAVSQGVYDLFRGEDPRAVAALADSVATRVRARSAEPPPRTEITPVADADRYLGTWRDDALGTLRVERHGDSLIARMGDSWGVAAGTPNRPGVLATSLIGGGRMLAFDFGPEGGPAASVRMLGRTFVRVAPGDTLRWTPSWPGTQMAVVKGDLRRGEWTFLFRMPSGYWIHPHTHPVDARLRVVSGTLLVGMGEALDSTVVRTLAPGDTMLVHRAMAHYEGTTGETVLEVRGSGTWGITFIDPRKDPARAASAR